MPLIGISACSKVEDYRQAILHAGGSVLVLETGSRPLEAFEAIDGLLLSGGDDVDPARYGAESHPSVTGVNRDRDAFEIALIQEARRRDLPILGICRGIQILNVACGGTLVQDIPSQVPGAVEHRFAVPPHQAFSLAHDVWIEEDSLIGRLLGERLADADACTVNSRHHQAVQAPAPGFQVSATAPDGVVEAIEDPAARFCVGVQWHPENFWRTGEFRALFEGFLQAAERRA